MFRGVDPGKRGEWEERLRRYAKSGLTVVEFCEWEGVSTATFYNWRKKLTGGFGKRPVTGSRRVTLSRAEPEFQLDRTSFLPVRVTPQSAATSDPFRIEIRLANGVCIFVPNPDAGVLETVIAAVGGLPSTGDCQARAHDELTEDIAC